MSADFLNPSFEVASPQDSAVSRVEDDKDRKISLSADDVFRQEIRQSPSYPQAELAFRYHLRDKSAPYAPKIQRYYSVYLQYVLQKFHEIAPDSLADVKQYFVSAYVAEADPQLAKAYPQLKKVPVIHQLRENILLAVDSSAGQIIPGEQQKSHDTSPQLIEHELNWLGSLARQEGALHAPSSVREKQINRLHAVI